MKIFLLLFSCDDIDAKNSLAAILEYFFYYPKAQKIT